jgi:hypothetical protein
MGDNEVRDFWLQFVKNQKQKAYPSITWSQNVALATQTGVKAALYDHFARRMTN